MANSVNPDQTAPIGAVCSGSTLFASILNWSVMLGNYLQQTTLADDIFRADIPNYRCSSIFRILRDDDFWVLVLPQLSTKIQQRCKNVNMLACVCMHIYISTESL